MPAFLIAVTVAALGGIMAALVLKLFFPKATVTKVVVTVVSCGLVAGGAAGGAGMTYQQLLEQVVSQRYQIDSLTDAIVELQANLDEAEEVFARARALNEASP